MSIELKSYQQKHVDKIIKHIKNIDGIYCDFSPMGSGKTVVTNFVAKYFNLPMIVVCPLSVKNNWNETAKILDNNIVTVITYSLLINNNKLFRITDDIFIPQILDSLDKYMIVFDEFHSLKNNSKQYFYAHQFIKYALKNRNNVVALLSGTPFDKKSNSKNLLNLLGMADSKNTGETMYQSIQVCKKINLDKTNKILKILDPTNSKNFDDINMELLLQIIMPIYKFCMKIYELDYKIDVKNGFYKLSKDDTDDIRVLYGKLSMYLRFTKNNLGETIADVRNNSFGKIQKLLHQIEEIKVKIFIRVAKQYLDKNKNYKVIVYLNYLKNINKVYQELNNYGALLLIGDVKQKDRDLNIMLFQNDDNYRLLVSNIAVGGVGVNLDDRTGDRPRIMLISPSYNFIQLHQSIGRIYRLTTKSDSIVRIMYSKAPEEKVIIKSLNNKNLTVNSISCDNERYNFFKNLEEYVE